MSERNSEPIKVGVIGLGRAGWNIHIQRMRNDPRFQVSAVADRHIDRCNEAKAEFGCEIFTDCAQLIEEADCEVVVVASQSNDHGPQSIKALCSGRHVVVEKPMALSTDEATRMIEAAEKSGRKLFVHQNYRYSPDVHHLQEVIQSGLLGHIFEIRIRALSFSRRNDWQTLQKFGGGTLNNLGAHFIDIALLLLNSPVQRIFADLKLTTNAGDADDHATIMLKGQNGRTVELKLSSSCAFPEPLWTLLGTNGSLISDGITSEIKYFDPNQLMPLTVNEGTPVGRKYGWGEELPWQEETRPSIASVPSDFYDNVFDVLRKSKKMDIAPEHVREVIRISEIARKDNPTLSMA